MITPSPRVEALLAALAADAPYRDAILGDLAEEFAIRVEEQGVVEARRWYRLQALRTAPHVLRQWARRLRSFDIAQLIAFTMIGNVAIGLVGRAIRTAIVMSFGVAVDNSALVDIAWRDLVEAQAVHANLAYFGGAASSVLFGYVLARLQRRAPLATCVVVGAALLVQLFLIAFLVDRPGLWLRLTLAVVVASGTVLGGALRTLRTPSPHAPVT